MRKIFSLPLTIVTLIVLSVTVDSCKKQDSPASVQSSVNEEKFLLVPSEAPLAVKRIAETIRHQNKKKPFLDRFIKEVGYAIWDQAHIMSKNFSNARSSNMADESEEYTILVPLVLENTKFVNSFMVCNVNGEEVIIKLVNGKKYAAYGFDDLDQVNADLVAYQLMFYDYSLFGNQYFKIKDNRLFHLQEYGVDIENVYAKIESIEIVPKPPTPKCTRIVLVDLNGNLVGGANPLLENCETTWVTVSGAPGWNPWEDDDEFEPPGSGGSAGDEEWYEQPCIESTPSTPPPPGYAYPPECSDPIPVEPVNPKELSFMSDFSNLDNPIAAEDGPIIENGVDVEDVPGNTPPDNPVIIGSTTPRGNTEDMEHGKNGNTQGIHAHLLTKTDDQLFELMNVLFASCTIFDSELADVGGEMMQKFKDRTGRTYSNAILNEKVSVSSGLINFLKRFGTELDKELNRTGGNINNINKINMGTDRPIFNGIYNKFNGLQILINDTEYTEIQLDNFQIANGEWTATVTVTIHDHFGLDKHDALVYQGKHPGFGAWWLLQHTRDYVPFETVVTVRKQIKSRL